MATSGDFLLATSGDYSMAADTWSHRSRGGAVPPLAAARFCDPFDQEFGSMSGGMDTSRLQCGEPTVRSCPRAGPL
jgi:hypothetical protein